MNSITEDITKATNDLKINWPKLDIKPIEAKDILDSLKFNKMMPDAYQQSTVLPI